MSIYQKILQHKLAANLMMLVVIMAGIWGMGQVRSQLFPDIELPLVRAQISWENADAKAVSNGITQGLDQALQETNSFQFVRSTSRDERVNVFASLEEGITGTEGLEIINTAIDSLSLPNDAVVDSVELVENTEPVSSVLIYGNLNLSELSQLGLEAKQSLLNTGVLSVNLSGAPTVERIIDVNLVALNAIGMTLSELQTSINNQFTSTPAGLVTVGQNATQMVSQSKDWSIEELNNTIIKQTNDSVIYLKDIANIYQEFNNNDVLYYLGVPAIQLDIERAAGEDTLENAKKINAWMDEYKDQMPDQVDLVQINQVWKIVEAQLQLVIDNGIGGMILVIIVLFIFLRTRLAIWVAAGIPISFLATLAFMGYNDTTINTISLFGFIIAIGIIVDDAIVVAEDAATLESEGMEPEQASQTAARRMFPAVLASSLTTIAAFLPLMLIGGSFGNFIIDIPIVVTAAIVASLIECFLILPGHLGHGKRNKSPSKSRLRIEAKINQFRDGPFTKLVNYTLKHGSIFIGLILFCSILTAGVVASGRIGFQATPSLDEPTLTVTMDLLEDTSLENAKKILDDLEVIVEDINQQAGGQLVETLIQQFNQAENPTRINLEIILSSDTDRAFSNSEIMAMIQEEFTLPNDVRSFSTQRRFRGPGGGGDLEIAIEGDDIDEIKSAAEMLQSQLEQLTLLEDITDDLPWGTQQFELSLTPVAIAQGISLDNISRQLSAMVSGLTLTTIEDGYQSIPVKLQLVEHQRQSQAWLQSLPIKLSQDLSLPLGSLVEFDFKRALDRITARDGVLSIEVTASYSGDQLTDLYQELENNQLKAMTDQFDVTWQFEGQSRELESFFADAKIAVVVSLLLIFFILAWVFESWVWPLAVLVTVPFGLIGAVMGHYIMGLSLSTVSIFGIIGLSGIVINDSIVLVTVFRRLSAQGKSLYDATVEASVSRLRPVVLTSITTMAGLTPLLFETSLDAALLKPIAVGLVFGLGFSTVLILLMVPVLLYNLGKLQRFIGK